MRVIKKLKCGSVRTVLSLRNNLILSRDITESGVICILRYGDLCNTG